MEKSPEMLSFPFHSASIINEDRKDCIEIQSDPGGSIKLELALDVPVNSQKWKKGDKILLG